MCVYVCNNIICVTLCYMHVCQTHKYRLDLVVDGGGGRKGFVHYSIQFITDCVCLFSACTLCLCVRVCVVCVCSYSYASLVYDTKPSSEWLYSASDVQFKYSLSSNSFKA